MSLFLINLQNKFEILKSLVGYINKLISKGENQTLDFKFEISNARKIAKTLASFANTDGGILLVGVKDNGAIAGIRSEEEIFMIDAAAKMYCRPEIKFEAKMWNVDGKQVLEIIIPQSNKKYHKALDDDNKWKTYIRKQDQNLLAPEILIRFYKEKEKKIIKINYSRKEELLFDLLRDYGEITQKKFSDLAQINLKQAEKILVDFLILDIIEISINEKDITFSFKKNQIK